MQSYAYVRVSSREQNLDRQLDAMAALNIPSLIIYEDKQSGKTFERPAYCRLLRRIRQGDVLYVKAIDRLGRNYHEILEQWRIITKEKMCDIVVLDMPLLDTRSRGNDLTGTFIADLVLQILSYVAQTEREFIHERQREGIAAAKARGVKFGRPSIVLPDAALSECCFLYEMRMITLREGGRRLGVSYNTFLRRFQERNCEKIENI